MEKKETNLYRDKQKKNFCIKCVPCKKKLKMIDFSLRMVSLLPGYGLYSILLFIAEIKKKFLKFVYK